MRRRISSLWMVIDHHEKVCRHQRHDNATATFSEQGDESVSIQLGAIFNRQALRQNKKN
jgi:hypothetical protein